MRLLNSLRVFRHSFELFRVANITTSLYRSKQLDQLPDALFDTFDDLVPVRVNCYIGDSVVCLDDYPMHMMIGSGLLLDPFGDLNQDIVPKRLKPWVYAKIGHTQLYLSKDRRPVSLHDIGIEKAPVPVNYYRIIDAISHSSYSNIRCVELKRPNSVR